MRNLDELIITNIDLARLQPVLDANDTPAAESLDAELHRARIVSQRDVPSDVVTMNSEVVYEDLATGARRRLKVVFPHDADPGEGHVSVLAPIGSALLGMRVHQTSEWPTPSGPKRIRVLELRYQPEAAGDFDR